MTNMMKIAVAASAVMLLGACGTTGGYNPHDPVNVTPNATRTAGTAITAVIVTAKPVTIQPRKSLVGALAGGVIGGVVGSQIGGGDTAQDIGTAVGALGGAVAGNKVGRMSQKNAGCQYIVARRGFDDTVVTQGGACRFKTGDKVRITVTNDGLAVESYY